MAVSLEKYLSWIRRHWVESGLIAIVGGVALYWITNKKLGFATPGAGMSRQQMMNVPSLVKPTPARMSQQEPERFSQFDMRFEFDRMQKGGPLDFRQEFDDDERRRFLPMIMSAPGVDIPLVLFIFGATYNSEIASDCIVYPDAPGIWEQAANGCWVPVTMADEQLIEQIAYQRGEKLGPIIISG